MSKSKVVSLLVDWIAFGKNSRKAFNFEAGKGPKQLGVDDKDLVLLWAASKRRGERPGVAAYEKKEHGLDEETARLRLKDLERNWYVTESTEPESREYHNHQTFSRIRDYPVTRYALTDKGHMAAIGILAMRSGLASEIRNSEWYKYPLIIPQFSNETSTTRSLGFQIDLYNWFYNTVDHNLSSKAALVHVQSRSDLLELWENIVASDFPHVEEIIAREEKATGNKVISDNVRAFFRQGHERIKRFGSLAGQYAYNVNPSHKHESPVILGDSTKAY